MSEGSLKGDGLGPELKNVFVDFSENTSAHAPPKVRYFMFYQLSVTICSQPLNP